MATTTEDVNITVETGVGPVVRAGANQVALLAPLDAGATVSANVVKKYRRASDIATDHGDGSALHNGAKTAFASGLPFVFAVGVAPKSGSPFTETYGAASAVTDSDDAGADVLQNLPATSITSVVRDGTPLTVLFTNKDPLTLSPGADEIAINPSTGAWKLGTATTGASSGAVFIYAAHDWDAAFEKLDLEEYEYHVPAGFALNGQNFGIFQTFVTHGTTEKRMTSAGLDSGVATTDVDGSGDFDISSLSNGRLYPVFAAHYTGDLTVGAAAAAATRRVNATLKRQVAPQGVTFTDSYTRSDFGDEATPANGTFHFLGVNAVFRDKGGTYRISNDRARVGLTDFYRFGSTMRSQLFAEKRIAEDVRAARQSSGTALPYTDGGIASIRSVILGALGFMRDEGIVESFVVIMPRKKDVAAADRANRVLTGVQAAVLLPGQIHLTELDLKLEV